MNFFHWITVSIAALFMSLLGTLGLSPQPAPVQQAVPTQVLNATTTLQIQPSISQQGTVWVSLSDPRNTEYVERNGYVYYQFADDGLMPGAGPSTFSVLIDLRNASDSLPCLAKDKNFVYVCTDPVPGVDPATFFIPDAANSSGPLRLIDISADKNHVYSFSSAYNNQPPTLEIVGSADPSTFTYLGDATDGIITDGTYYKDASHVYYADDIDTTDTSPTIIEGADAETFHLADPESGPYGMYGNILSCGSDCSYDASDKNHKYLDGQIVQ